MSFLSTVVWYSKPNRSNNLTKSVAFIICLLQKWNYFSTLGFKYFEFLFMYERMLNWIWIFSMFVLALKCIDSPKILCIRYLLPSGVWEYHQVFNRPLTYLSAGTLLLVYVSKDIDNCVGSASNTIAKWIH